MNKILIAEDDKFLSSAYRVKLAKEGFDVKIVGSGIDLLEQLKSYSYNFRFGNAEQGRIWNIEGHESQ